MQDAIYKAWLIDVKLYGADYRSIYNPHESDDFNNGLFNEGDNMKFKGDIVITDPCYVVNDEDWEFSEYGDRMDKLGFTDYLVRSTIVGDGL